MSTRAKILLINSGSKPIKIIPKKDVITKNHLLKLNFSLRKKLLKIIANGIASWDPIITGETILDSCKDR